jgi:hypothetical protein
MQLDTRATYGGAVATFKRAGVVLVVTYLGVLTPGTLARVRADTRTQAHARQCRAVVADARGTIFALDGAALAPPGKPQLAQKPVAIVVPEIALEMFQRHAWEMARRGYLRGVFTDLGRALRWAQEKSPLGPLPDSSARAGLLLRAASGVARRPRSGRSTQQDPLPEGSTPDT